MRGKEDGVGQCIGLQMAKVRLSATVLCQSLYRHSAIKHIESLICFIKVYPPTQQSWLSDTLKDQRNSQLDLIFRVNERRCGAKPMYGQEVLDFLTFLPGPRPRPAPLSSLGEWGRSGHSSCLFSQWQNKYDFWFQSHAVKEAIHSIEERVDMLNDTIDR